MKVQNAFDVGGALSISPYQNASSPPTMVTAIAASLQGPARYHLDQHPAPVSAALPACTPALAAAVPDAVPVPTAVFSTFDVLSGDELSGFWDEQLRLRRRLDECKALPRASWCSAGARAAPGGI
jgi:hypothetical protein